MKSGCFCAVRRTLVARSGGSRFDLRWSRSRRQARMKWRGHPNTGLRFSAATAAEGPTPRLPNYQLRTSSIARYHYYIVGAEQGANSAVAARTREIYRGANGDRWLLACDPDTARVFVRHEPNLPSGGQVADIEI